MHVVARARLVLARRPWAYWALVAILAALAAATVQGEMTSIAAARDRWGSTRTVLVARHQLEPGDPIAADPVALPIAAIPEAALEEAPGGSLVRQRVAVGEVLTELDVTAHRGPAALAEPGTVVVALSDPLAREVTPGLRVQIVADGLVIADRAQVTGVVDEVIFVAVRSGEAPAVAASTRAGSASLLYLP
jgi:hypothetical protein